MHARKNEGAALLSTPRRRRRRPSSSTSINCGPPRGLGTTTACTPADDGGDGDPSLWWLWGRVLVMAVKDGVRLHLAGAEIADNSGEDASGKRGGRRSAGGKANGQSTGTPERTGVEEERVLGELSSLEAHQEAMQYLGRHGYYPVYDAGVERLLLSISPSESMKCRPFHLRADVPHGERGSFRPLGQCCSRDWVAHVSCTIDLSPQRHP